MRARDASCPSPIISLHGDLLCQILQRVCDPASQCALGQTCKDMRDLVRKNMVEAQCADLRCRFPGGEWAMREAAAGRYHPDATLRLARKDRHSLAQCAVIAASHDRTDLLRRMYRAHPGELRSFGTLHLQMLDFSNWPLRERTDAVFRELFEDFDDVVRMREKRPHLREARV